MCGGELWELVNKHGVLPEDLTRIYIAEIAIALGIFMTIILM